MSQQSAATRIERDSMGEIEVPNRALWGAQTQRAIQNFAFSGRPMPPAFIRAVALIKACAAEANGALGLLTPEVALAIVNAAETIMHGQHGDQFPVDVYQTGSGTSTNMNVNEVVAHLATASLGQVVHPNDQVNLAQSSNDVIPTAIHVSTVLMLERDLLPALNDLERRIARRAGPLHDVVKTGRTHLMDATPIRMSQELGAWESQLAQARQRLEQTRMRLLAVAQGATAVGSGLNAPADFLPLFLAGLQRRTGLPFRAADNPFAALAGQETALELSGHLKVLAVVLMKIANDLRWMNSGPLAGLGEITLPALQPGSSIMPGKVNPVIPEAVAQIAAQVIGHDAAITVAAQSGNFQLNVMLPLLADNLLNALTLLTRACGALGHQAIDGFVVHTEHMRALVARNPVLVTALNPLIGYEAGAQIAKLALERGVAVREVAREMTDLPDSEIDRLLDPQVLADGGLAQDRAKPEDLGPES